MVGALTTALARYARHSLAIAGLALAVAAGVAFLPAGASNAPRERSATPILASQMSDDSLGAVRSVFTTSATVWPGHAEAAELIGSAEATAAATVTPAASATATEEAETGQATVSSALVDSTAAQSPTATATATAAPTVEQSAAPITPVPTELAAAPTAVPTEAAVYSSGLSSVQAWLAQSPWPPELWPTAERVIMCESSGNPAAVGPGGYVGLMQVDPSLHGPVPADPVAQLAQGYDVYLRQGWGAWGCY